MSQVPIKRDTMKTSQHSTRILSETLNKTADAARMVAATHSGAEPGGNVPTDTWRLPKDETILLLKALDATSKAVSDVAVSSRLADETNTESEQLSAKTRNTLDLTRYAISPEPEDVEIPLMRPGIGRVTGDRNFAISQRVGTISLAVWESMSEKRLKELDTVLKRIVQKVCADSEISWDLTGTIIQQELATFGFRFATASYFSGDPGYDRARDTGASDLARILALSDYCRPAQGRHWYTDEMIRVVQRLMELRGFQV